MPSFKRPLINIVTDEKGFAKFVTYKDKVIPDVTDATIYLSGREVATVELTVRPVHIETSAELCSVAMKCPVCEFYQIHRCEIAEDQEDDNCTG